MASDKTFSLYQLWASGFTRRWHMHAAMSSFDDYICAHQGRCAQLVITLFPDHSIELLRAAVTHDAAEYVVGDLSRPFKEVGGDLVQAHAALEADVRQSMGFEQNLNEQDAARLHFVDVLDSYLFVGLRNPAELQRNGWADARSDLLTQANRLGCLRKGREILWDADAGAFE